MKRLKRGVSLFASTNPDQYFCGTLKRAVRIDSPESKQQVQLLGGPDFLRAQPDSQLLNELSALQLIDTSESALTLTKRYDAGATERDAAFQQLRARVAAELTQTTWIDGVTDTGVKVLSARQSYLIEISGSNRVATLLYSLLLASGVTQVRYCEKSEAKVRISDLDIALAGIAPKDIGASLIKEREGRRQDLSLFPLDKEFSYLDEISTPDLAIHCGELDPEKYVQWMASGLPFLHIPNPIADVAEIGPLVIPGKTPCIRCAQMSRQDHSGAALTPTLPTSLTPTADGYPIIAAHYVAAIAASLALAFCDALTLDKECGVTGKVTICDYQSLSTPYEIVIARHPLCGCSFNDR
jgi:hypothetical protein